MAEAGRDFGIEDVLTRTLDEALPHCSCATPAVEELHGAVSFCCIFCLPDAGTRDPEVEFPALPAYKDGEALCVVRRNKELPGLCLVVPAAAECGLCGTIIPLGGLLVLRIFSAVLRLTCEVA